jgi:5-methylcytosine-specific restriction endonuclease McrA
MNLSNKLKRKAVKLAWAVRASSMTDNEVADELRKTADPFLYSEAWRKLRREAAERYGLVCFKCGRENSRKFPINMDHIKPRKYYPELALDIENLQPLCGPCNKAKGNKVTGVFKTQH